MATIPVPVHFDGHNINIITEDSPSTHKCWSKSGNLKRKARPKIPPCAANEVYIQNLSMPLKSPSNKENCASSPTDEHDAAPDSPERTPEHVQECRNRAQFNARTPGSSENDADSVNPYASANIPSQAVARGAKDSDSAKTTPHKYNPNAKSFTPSSSGIPSKPPKTVHTAAKNIVQASGNSRRSKMCTYVPVNRGQNGPGQVGRVQTAGTANGGQAQTRGKGAVVTDAQLIKLGFNPAEFGSHDDVGFDQEDQRGKDRQSLYKTELCREWSTSGWCYYNKRCSFAHGLHELRPVFRSKKWRTKRCRNWHTTGYCPYEHRCQFLHDQSPPRRMQDYAGTAVNPTGMAGVVEVPKQPVYFHYKVDCDRKATNTDDVADPTTTAQEGEAVSSDDGAAQAKAKDTSAMARLVMVNKVNRDAKEDKFANAKYPEMNMAPRQRAQHQREQRERQSALQRQAQRLRAKKKRAQIKDTVITPFNPIVPPLNGPITAFNPMASMTPMTLNPAMPAMPTMPTMPGVGPITATPLGAGSVASAVSGRVPAQHPAAPTTGSMFMPSLPPSIDVQAYLNLTPSPGTVPVSTVGLKGDEPAEAVQQQLELKLSEQQQKLQEMHQKVRDAAVRGQVNHAEANHTLEHEMPLTDLEASPECESIGEDLLHSFLPNDPLIDAAKGDKGDKAKAKEKKAKGGKRLDPPLLPPPLLHLQLSQNSVVNSAVNAAITTPTAMSTKSAVSSTKLVPMTPTLATTPASGAAAASTASATKAVQATVPTNLKMPGVPMTPPSATGTTPTTTHHFHHHYVPSATLQGVYAQQAHAHAHAYAAAHVNHGAYPVPMTTTPGLGPAASPYAGMSSMAGGMAPLGSMPMSMAGMAGMAGMMPGVPVTPNPAMPAGGVGVGAAQGVTPVMPPMPPMQYLPYNAGLSASMQSPNPLAWDYASRHY